MTHRHHPLEGQVFAVMMSGRREVVVRLDDGTTMRMPRAWTDAEGRPPEPARQSVFTVEALRELLDRLPFLSP